jgi:hypothetical protein
MVHHENKQDSGEAWIRNGVCAVGFRTEADFDLTNVNSRQDLFIACNPKADKKRLGELFKFLSIQEGDLIIANFGNGLIGAVGLVTGKYVFNRENEVGKKFGYPHQRAVAWQDTPREFRKDNLPGLISEQIGHTPGITIKEIVSIYNSDSFLTMLNNLKIKSYEGKYNEDLVKAGLSKYLKRNLNSLEMGLILNTEETHLDKHNRPDFTAKDKNGCEVIIECKGSFAGISAVDQAVRYRRVKGQNSRYFLVAFSFDESARVKAKKEGIELFEVDLLFNKLIEK